MKKNDALAELAEMEKGFLEQLKELEKMKGENTEAIDEIIENRDSLKKQYYTEEPVAEGSVEDVKRKTVEPYLEKIEQAHQDRLEQRKKLLDMEAKIQDALKMLEERRKDILEKIPD